MSLKSALVGAAGASVLSAILQLVNGILLARMLGPEGRGMYGELLFWAMTVNGLTSFAIYDAALVRLRKLGSIPIVERGSLFTLTALTTGINVLALSVLMGLAFIGYLDTDPSYLLEYIAYGVTVNFIFMLGAIERSKLEFHSLSIERILTPASYTILLLTFWFVGASVRQVFILLILANVPVLVLRIVRNCRDLSFALSLDSMYANARVALRFFSVAACLVLINQIDKAIVLANFDKATAGQYFVAYSLAGAGYAFVSSSLQMVMLPAMLGVPPRVRRRQLERAGRFAVALSFAALVAITVAAGPVIHFAFGAEYDDAQHYAVWVSLALALMPLISLMEAANMALVRNWAAIELHVITIGCLLVGWSLGYVASIEHICALFAAGRLLSVSIGMRHLIRYPLCIRPVRFLSVQRDDFTDLFSLSSRLLRRA
jgi:antigen flippase